MGQIANRMLIKAIFKLKKKIKERNAEKIQQLLKAKRKTRQKNNLRFVGIRILMV